VVSTTSVGRYPQRVVAARTAVWVLNAEDDTISRIDPATRAVVHTFAVGPVLSDLEVAGGSLWVASPLTNTLLRIDESDDSVAARVRLPNPLLLAADPKRIWVVGLNLATVDLRTEKADVVWDPHPGGPRRPSSDATGDLAVIGRFVYFGGGSQLLRVDGRTGDESPSREFAPFAEIGGLAAGDGTLWVTSSARNALWQVDPQSLTPTRTIPVGARPVGVALGAGSLWVANSGDGSVSRIDPTTGSVVATIHVGGAPYGIVVSHGLVWVTLL
jgi:YVTN family beta-propeller protein